MLRGSPNGHTDLGARARLYRPWSAFAAPRSRQDRPRRRSESPRTRQDRLRRRSESPRACQDRPWAAILVDLGGLEGRFWTFFDALSLEQAHSREEAATYEKTVKTDGFYMFFTCPTLRPRFENQPKIDPGGRKMAPKITTTKNSYQVQTRTRNLP